MLGLTERDDRLRAVLVREFIGGGHGLITVHLGDGVVMAEWSDKGLLAMNRDGVQTGRARLSTADAADEELTRVATAVGVPPDQLVRVIDTTVAFDANDLVPTSSGSPPVVGFEEAEHVVEADLDLATGAVSVVGCTESPSLDDAPHAEPGRYRVRVAYVPAAAPAKVKPAWTTTKSAAGPAGTETSAWPCSPGRADGRSGSQLNCRSAAILIM
ncbi:hypothetical protein [Micromonospora cremea]|uniref:Uncharacterized protein n=1 Tax=Micromonospora cremea TaxID=709881 RepID=A0A1N5U548_9ACTN|nr:hypothetical protein [Micromonospora cremea]SIM55964.1 hypothetical protein SAMN04489832_0621 [Micromonospora cremea]